MLKGKKSSEEAVQSLNRIKLPLEGGIRALSGIKELLATAESSRGNSVELGWTTGTVGQTFVLNVQWDINADDPIWSLYEENDSGSKKIWSQSFAAADIDLFYDVLVMSCGGPTTASEKLSDILKPKTSEDRGNQPGPLGEALSKDKKSQPDTNEAAGPTSIPNQSGSPFPATDFVPPPYNVPPAVAPFPVPYPPLMAPGQGYMTPPIMPPPGWTFAPVPASNVSPTLPGNPYAPQQSTAPMIQPIAEPLSTLPIDASLVNKRYEISLADLLKRAKLISDDSLAAALKIQTLVQNGKVPVDEAIKILKQHHQKGESIDIHIGSVDSAPETDAKSTTPVSAGRAKPISKEQAAAFELLEKAGLLRKDDMTTAQNVGRKHGGDLVSILKAAQKLDDKTMEAALICVALLSDDLMKIEQCVIALNYCNRSRVGFDEAMAELNWENPRNKV